ncbi:hypothetical protein GCM10012285_10830 [Streptomyces kronopolitis]|uniref:Uncharacterized protein n=1 Tax=Streptomyces kronopolitis TaxID=1612435 RepID=A0ABQ2J0F8_9ACTN|nr:hypothetical protein GCM10012285_10830 [Streptomyces kronopolitis]
MRVLVGAPFDLGGPECPSSGAAEPLDSPAQLSPTQPDPAQPDPAQPDPTRLDPPPAPLRTGAERVPPRPLMGPLRQTGPPVGR